MRIALVEDDPILRHSLGTLLSGERKVQVVGTFDSAEAALAWLDGGEGEPDVMVVDIDLPGMSGVEFIRALKTHHADIEAMAYTIAADRGTVLAAIKAGASGYLLKGSTPRELVEAIHAIYEGGAPMSPRIAKRVLLELRETPQGKPSPLTARETDILSNIEEGLSLKEICEHFSISLHTVHTHVKRIYEKLQACSRQEALLKARRQGIL